MSSEYQESSSSGTYCPSCETTDCFCGSYVPVALYRAPAPGEPIDLENPLYVIPPEERRLMTYNPALITLKDVTEGWETAGVGGDYNMDPKLYFSVELGMWVMQYGRLALSPAFEFTAGLFRFYEFVNCVDGCSGLLYIDTCDSTVIYLECWTEP